ncbi:restriction endonuclease subunit S [Streptomyces sp. NBC_00435]|uniref:restriction endonuclease subunit S n=1 Tax=Streptomyces sp. NBC_00435 TaxID=2903649 RepID=UPI002E1FE5EE
MTLYRVKNIARINAQTLPEGTQADFSFRYIDIGAVDGLGNISIPTEGITFEKSPSRARRLAPAGSVIVSTVRTYLKAIAPVPKSDDPLVFSTGFAVLEATDQVDQRYLAYHCQSQPFIEAIVARSVGVSYPAINASEIGNLPIELPSLDEQRRIGDFLDGEISRIDTLVALRARQRDVVQTRKRAHIEKLLKECRSGEWTRVKYLLRARPRYGVLVPAFVDDGVPFVRVNDLLDLPGKVSGLARIPKALSDQYARTVVRPRDVLLSVVGTLGRAAVATDDLVGVNIARAVCSIRLRPDVSPSLFVAWAGTSEFEHQALLATGSDSAQPTLGMEDLSNFTVRWPADLRDQESLVDQAEESQRTHGELIRRTENQLALLAERRQALITAAVTGQLDVTTARPAHDRDL